MAPYGLGFGTLTLSNGASIITHSGSNRGWNSFFAALPGAGNGLVVLTNSDNGGAFIANVVSNWAGYVGQAHGVTDLPSAVSLRSCPIQERIAGSEAPVRKLLRIDRLR